MGSGWAPSKSGLFGASVSLLVREKAGFDLWGVLLALNIFYVMTKDKRWHSDGAKIILSQV